MVSFTPLLLYSQANCPRYPLDGRLNGPHGRSERYGEEKNLTPVGNRIPASSPSLYRLTYHDSKTDGLINIKTKIDLAYLKSNIFFLVIQISLLYIVKDILFQIINGTFRKGSIE
jgi:hypothetical protein